MVSVQKPITPLNTLIRSLSSLKESPLNDEKVTYKLPVKDVSQERKSLLSVFHTDYNLALNMSTLLNSIDLSAEGIKKMFAERQERILAVNQQYLPLRAETLGSDLAAAHFVVHRGGKVRFRGQEKWIELDKETEESSLPKFFDESFAAEALDCSQMTLTHQGLLNMSKLIWDLRWILSYFYITWTDFSQKLLTIFSGWVWKTVRTLMIGAWIVLRVSTIQV